MKGGKIFPFNMIQQLIYWSERNLFSTTYFEISLYLTDSEIKMQLGALFHPNLFDRIFFFLISVNHSRAVLGARN
jgi:hypothetical protein